MASDAAAQANTSPDVAETYQQREYKEAQQKRMQGVENIVFSGDRSTADIIRSYPFLNGLLKEAIQLISPFLVESAV